MIGWELGWFIFFAILTGYYFKTIIEHGVSGIEDTLEDGVSKIRDTLDRIDHHITEKE